MSQKEEERTPEFFRDASGQSCLSNCIICDAKMMSAQDSKAGLVCQNPACTENAPRKWEEMADELKDVKENMEDARTRMRKMEEALHFVHAHLKRKKNKKGKVMGIAALPEFMLDNIDEILMP